MRIALFHSTLGLRDVERQLADALGRDGHDVLLPDLFDGRVAGTIEEGLALKVAVGWASICARARTALCDAPSDTVLVGVSMGAGVVSELWCERPETAAVVLLHGYAVIPACVRPGVRATLHVAVGDRFAPEETISRWQQDAASRGVDAEVYRYPSPGHFFTDRASEDYDERAAQTLLARVRAFLQPAGTAPPIA